MNKKVIISIIALAIAVCLFFVIWEIIGRDESHMQDTNYVKENNSLNVDESKNIVNISEEVTDECTEDWEEYNSELQKAFEEASNNLGEDDTHYLLKNENGYIYVYCLDENNVEYLYKRTTISVDYLSQEDIDELKVGIEVIGSEALNKILEDFE